MTHRPAWLVLLVVSCLPDPAPPAEAYSVPRLLGAATRGERVAGIDPTLLVVPAGALVPFRGPPAEPAMVFAGDLDQLAVLPAFRDGAPAAYLVTEVWDNHPRPWVQAEWVVRTSAPMPLVRVFSVDTRSTFYSPFWEEVTVFAPDDVTADELRSSQDILSRGYPMRRNRLWLYPVVPDAGVALAGAPTPVRPYSLQPVTTVFPMFKAYMDGRPLTFMVNLADRFTMEDYLPTENVIYDLVADVGTDPFALPAVLPPDAKREALARRVRAHLPASARVFIPAGWESLRDRLAARGITQVEVGAPGIDGGVAAAHALRVASSPGCFSRPEDFPHGCRWLDSEAALTGDRRVRLEPTSTLMTVIEVDL